MASQGFWHRFNLEEEDREACLRAVCNEYVGCPVKEFEEQGYCSYTLLIAPLSDTDHSTNGHRNDKEKNDGYRERDERLVQLRPAPHALDLDITHMASSLYPSLAPTVTLLDIPLPASLNAYTMCKLPGTPLSRLLPHTRTLTPTSHAHLSTLISSFATFISQALPPSPSLLSRTTRADSPMQPDLPSLTPLRGKVGSTLLPRLTKLAASLPCAPLRAAATRTLLALQNIPNYPIVLTHGDLIPTNILIDPHHWRISGVVDWAEAEMLPFGTCLYGLEHLLGFLEPHAGKGTGPEWIYYEGAEELRRLFWECLGEKVQGREDEVGVMRDLGVLLWYGIAWDGGKIERVVGEEDAEEVVMLRAFLGVE